MRSTASTVDEYLSELPDDRREVVAAIRQVIVDNLDEGFAEGMQYGMIGYFVPHERYPAGYHCDPRQPLPFASLAAQKNHLALYLFCIYAVPGEEERFRKAWLATGKKLDMGKSCIRFRRLEDVPLKVIGDTIARITLDEHIAQYEQATGREGGMQAKTTGAKKKARSKKAAAKKAAKKKAAKKKAGSKKAAKKRPVAKKQPVKRTAAAKKKAATKKRVGAKKKS